MVIAGLEFTDADTDHPINRNVNIKVRFLMVIKYLIKDIFLFKYKACAKLPIERSESCYSLKLLF